MPIPPSQRTRLIGINFVRLALLVTTGTVLNAQTAPSPGDGFNPNANGIVNTTVLQPDGKILIGGDLTQLHPDGHPAAGSGYLARLNHDGSVDASFTPNANGAVRPWFSSPMGRSSSAARS